MISETDISWEDARSSGQFVFICHSREDKARIAKSGLLAELARLRIHVVIDNAYNGLMPAEKVLHKYIHQIPVGRSWKAFIDEFARSADCILLLLSTTLLDRLRNKRGKYEWCVAEMRIGANAEKLLPVKIEENLEVDYDLINTLVASALEADQEIGLATWGCDSKEGTFQKLYESILEIFDARNKARSEILARDRNILSKAGLDILLDMMGRDGQCQSIAGARGGAAVTYCDQASRADRMAERMAVIELPRISSDEHHDPRLYRRDRIRAVDTARQSRWHVKTYSLSNERGDCAHIERLKGFKTSELTEFIEMNTTIRFSEENVVDADEAQQKYLINLEISINYRSWKEVINFIHRLSKEWGHSRRNNFCILVTLLWDKGWHEHDMTSVLPVEFMARWSTLLQGVCLANSSSLIFVEPLAPIYRNELNEWCHLVAACRRDGINDDRPARHLTEYFTRPRPRRRFWERQICCNKRSMEELRKEVRQPLNRWVNS